jgi:hypothetical protein
VAGEQVEPRVDYRRSRTAYTSPYDEAFDDDEGKTELLPSNALGLLLDIFTERHKWIMKELTRMNNARLRAYEAILHG